MAERTIVTIAQARIAQIHSVTVRSEVERRTIQNKLKDPSIVIVVGEHDADDDESAGTMSIDTLLNLAAGSSTRLGSEETPWSVRACVTLVNVQQTSRTYRTYATTWPLVSSAFVYADVQLRTSGRHRNACAYSVLSVGSLQRTSEVSLDLMKRALFCHRPRNVIDPSMLVAFEHWTSIDEVPLSDALTDVDFAALIVNEPFHMFDVLFGELQWRRIARARQWPLDFFVETLTPLFMAQPVHLCFGVTRAKLHPELGFLPNVTLSRWSAFLDEQTTPVCTEVEWLATFIYHEVFVGAQRGTLLGSENYLKVVNSVLLDECTSDLETGGHSCLCVQPTDPQFIKALVRTSRLFNRPRWLKRASQPVPTISAALFSRLTGAPMAKRSRPTNAKPSSSSPPPPPEQRAVQWLTDNGVIVYDDTAKAHFTAAAFAAEQDVVAAVRNTVQCSIARPLAPPFLVGWWHATNRRSLDPKQAGTATRTMNGRPLVLREGAEAWRDAALRRASAMLTRFRLIRPLGVRFPDEWTPDALPLCRSRRTSADTGQVEPTLTAEQRAAVDHACAHPITILVGAAGTGKTQVLRAIHSLFDARQVLAVTLSGQSANVLGQRLGCAAYTIHSVLMRHHAAVARLRALRSGDGEPRADFRCSPLRGVRALIVDEALQVPTELFARLVNALPAPLQRMVIVGDTNQLQSVDHGNLLLDCTRAVRTANVPSAAVHVLTQNFRSAAAPGITGLCAHLLSHAAARDRQQCTSLTPSQHRPEPPEATTPDLIYFGQSAVLTELPETMEDRLVKNTLQAMDHFRTLLPDDTRQLRPWDVHVVTFTRATARTLNAAVRLMFAKVRAATSAAANGGRMTFERSLLDKAMQRSAVLCVGDKFMFTRNFSLKSEGRPTVCFHNGQLLEVKLFYDEQLQTTDLTNTSAKFCRCRLCPTHDITCHDVTRVPPRRQRQLALAEIGDADSQPRWHSHRLDAVEPGTRRMLVARTINGTYAEVPVTPHVVRKSNWNFGYATTTHCTQGSEYPFVVYAVREYSPFETWRHAYTAASRAQRCLAVVTAGHRPNEPVSARKRILALAHTRCAARHTGLMRRLCDSLVN